MNLLYEHMKVVTKWAFGKCSHCFVVVMQTFFNLVLWAPFGRLALSLLAVPVSPWNVNVVTSLGFGLPCNTVYLV
jgi:hypothetical protein